MTNLGEDYPTPYAKGEIQLVRRDASYNREPVIFISFWVCHFEPVKRFRHLKWQQNDMLFLCQIAVISNDGIYTDFGISNAIFEQNQLQMTATLCIHQSSQNDRNLPDSKWNADDRFSTVGCVSVYTIWLKDNHTPPSGLWVQWNPWALKQPSPQMLCSPQLGLVWCPWASLNP